MTTEAATTELTPQQMWDEELAKREGATATAAASTQTSTESESVIEANVVDTTKTNSTAAEPGTTEQTNTGEVDQKTSASTEQPDVMAQILDKLNKLESRQRNVEGHIGGLKTSQQALQTAMEQARTSATKADVEAPTKGQVAAAAEDPAKWKELKKDFPEWAEATEELLGSRLAALQTPKGGIDPAELDKLVNERLQQVTGPLREEIIDSALDAVLPGWKDEVKTAKFGQWLQAQSKEVQDLAASPKVGDAAKMLRLYDAAQKADPSVQIREDRKQKLAQAAGLPKSQQVPKAKTVEEMSPQELWNYEAEKREKERKQRGY